MVHITAILCLSAMMAFATVASAVQLRPISTSDYENALGLQRRGLDDMTDLVLQDHSQLMYHGVSDDGQHHLANLTIHAPSGLSMVTMERFEGLTSAIDCNSDDGMISLTFQSEKAYKFALQEWAYINESDDDRFLLVGNHASCGANDDRQPYLISSLSEDTTMLTTRLTAQALPWFDVAGTYDIDFGRLAPIQKPNQLEERGFRHCHPVRGDCELDGDFDFQFENGKEGKRTNIVRDTQKIGMGGHSIDRFILDCVNCHMSGTFHVDVRLKIKHRHLKDFILKVSPQDISANFELEATLAYSKKLQATDNWKKELFRYPIPDAGIHMGDWLNIGATMANDVGCQIKPKGSATVSFGLEFSIPNGAQATLDVCNQKDSSASGWFVEDSLKPMAEINNASGSVEISVFDRSRIIFGVEIKDMEKFDVSLQLKMPVFTQSLEAAYDEKGLCDKESGASKTGVKATTKVGVTLAMVAEAKLGKKKKGPGLSVTLPLYSTAKALATGCVPLSIPGMAAAQPTHSANKSLWV